jgi:hypothetical protein
MAAWQFELLLIPRRSALRYGIQPNDRLTRAQFESTDWWEDHPPLASFDHLLSQVLPVGPSWSDDWHVFGSEDGDRILVLTTAGRIAEMCARIDTRSLDGGFVARLGAFAQASDLLLVGPDLRVFEPEREPILVEIELSDAREFVHDPTSFLERLRRRRLSEE